MLHRREFWVPASLASALLWVSASSCTPDERNLGLDLSSPKGGEAASYAGAAGSEEFAGASGSAGDESALGQAGKSGGAGSGATGSGGASHSNTGGTAGDHADEGGAENAGSAGAAFIGPCGDMDGNSVDDCSETLIQNSTFDSNVDHWAAGEWNASNGRPAKSKPSGSLLVLNDLPVVADTGFNLEAAEQCLQVTGNLTYEVAARVKIPAGQGGGLGMINLLIFANDECKGTFVTGLTPAITQAIDTWTVIASEFKMPTAARSMIVRLAASKPLVQPKLQVLFDDILVKQKLP